jgi:hypothetical protein
MKPLTAFCFLFSDNSLSLLAPSSGATKMRRRLAQTCAVLVAIAGVATVIEFATRAPLGFENLFFCHALFANGIQNPGRVSIASAFAFISLGVAPSLLDLESLRGIRTAQFLPLGVLLFLW